MIADIFNHDPKDDPKATLSKYQDFAVVCLRALADGIEAGQTIIEGFEVKRDVLTTSVQKVDQDHYVPSWVGGPLRIPAFTIYHVEGVK